MGHDAKEQTVLQKRKYVITAEAYVTGACKHGFL